MAAIVVIGGLSAVASAAPVQSSVSTRKEVAGDAQNVPSADDLAEFQGPDSDFSELRNLEACRQLSVRRRAAMIKREQLFAASTGRDGEEERAIETEVARIESSLGPACDGY